jgi:hypothetical protein
MEMGGFFAFFLILMVAGLAFWIWALVDCVRVPDDSLYQSGTKLVWVLVIVLAGWIGAIVYVVAGRPVSGAGPRQPPRPWPEAPSPSSAVLPAVPPPPPPPEHPSPPQPASPPTP